MQVTSKQLPRAKKPKPSASGNIAFSAWGGVLSSANASERIRMIRAGAEPYLVIDAAEFYHVPRKAMAEMIGLSSSTSERNIKSGTKLDPSATERLSRIALIEHHAEMVFGGPEQAKKWLLSPNVVFGESPLSYLDTEIGANEVRKVLNTIAYGGIA